MHGYMFASLDTLIQSVHMSGKDTPKNEAKRCNGALFLHYISTFFQRAFVLINTNRNDECKRELTLHYTVAYATLLPR